MGYWPTFLLIRPMDRVKNTIKSLIPSDCTIINYNDFSKSGKIKLINLKTKEIIEISHNLNVIEYSQSGLLDLSLIHI